MLPSRSLFSSALGLLATLSCSPAALVSAQVHTDCQPLNRTDCPPDPAFGMDFNFNFNATPSKSAWETTVGPVDFDKDNGAIFTIKKKGDSPTIRTKFYIFFGRIEMHLKVAPGVGIISSMMLLSDCLDEIDWEFMGGNDTHAETNYFGKGVQDYHNAIYHPVAGGVQSTFRNYTTHWTKDALDFYIDGNKVRTLLPKDANNTYYYPQTPMRLSLGIWAAGDPSQPIGVKEWAGGETDYKKGPFTMMVKSAQITDFSSGKEYSYGDKSGSWESIKIASGNSTVAATINAPPEKSIAEKWNDLPQLSKTAVYASGAGVAAIIVSALLYYFIRQRKIGAKEAKLAEERQRQERLELEQFKKAGIDPDSFREEGQEYNAKEMRDEGMTTSNAYSIPASPSNEKAWAAAGAAASIGAGAGAGAAAASGMRSPVPLLANGAQSPRGQSPGPFNQGGYGMDRTGSPAPAHPPPNFPLPATPANRSFSTPNPDMRHGSPAPSAGGYSDMGRTQSPRPMAPPQRSFTSNSYGNGGGGYGGGGQGYSGHQPGYGGNGNDGYWR